MEEINKKSTSLNDIYESVSKTLKELNKLKVLEQEGKIKVRHTGTLNPLFIDVLDPSIESELQNNPIVDTK